MEYTYRTFVILLAIPYFLWGVHTLRLRYQRNIELSPLVEVFTLAGLVVFYAIELKFLQAESAHITTFATLASIGLFVSGAALYGPMVVSVLSHVLVGQIAPLRQASVREPNYAVAEAYAREAKFEAAIREYERIARAFPKDPVARIRIADTLLKLSRPEQAALWFERSLEHLSVPEMNLSVTNRLADVYLRKLARPEDAERILRAYLSRFPQAGYADAVRKRLDNMNELQAAH
ncbi:MAG TPA: tetratricopeptide repeat protein [Candidatus Hydrogenedentes bacterium]|nr:tetratricopeptide repeat protein [Candidatus Hydrogenedentota bacterium]